MKKVFNYIALAAAAVGLSGVAQAVPQLRVFDGTTTITISDNGAGDSQGANGQIVWIGSIGNWSFNVHTGSTYPIIGSLTNPQLDLTFNATSTAAGGTVQILFSADGFGPTDGTTLAAIGGTIANGGTVVYDTFGGSSNTVFDTGSLLTSQGPFGPVAFSSTTTGGSVNNAGPYSLTQRVTITHTGAGQTTGDAFLSVPDSGLSVLLLGAGLTCLGAIGRWRKKLGC